MRQIILIAAAASALVHIPAPAVAAQSMHASQSEERQTGTFAGANVRLEFGASRRVRPVARLQAGVTHQFRGTGPAPSARANTYRGLELGLGRAGRPEFYVGGQNSRQIGERLNLTGSSPNALWIVFGVALVAVTILVVTNLDDLGDGLDGRGTN